MSGRGKRTNPLLLLLMVILCIGSGLLFTHSSADPALFGNGISSEISLATNQDTKASDNKSGETDEKDALISSAPTSSPAPTLVPTPTASAEAASGVWTASGSSWTFLVDGTPYTGWLTDTDGKTYYFDKDGIMQTGWVDDGGKRYYMDLDGIMQKNCTITIDGKSYELLADGSLKDDSGEASEEESTSDQKKDTDAEKTAAKAEAQPTSTPEPTPTPSEPRYVALTFDDGPSSFTGRLLDCLEKNNAKATFFMVGTEIVSFPDEVKRMEELGCELGNHTYNHVDLTTLSAEDMSAEIAGVDEALESLVGHGATVLRPPYGSINDSVRSTVGTPMILWSIDTLDWKTQDAQQTVDTALSEVKDGSIILMHDIFSESVDAAEILIPKLIEQGYQLVTIHELAQIKGTELQTGIAYGDFTEEE